MSRSLKRSEILFQVFLQKLEMFLTQNPQLKRKSIYQTQKVLKSFHTSSRKRNLEESGKARDPQKPGNISEQLLKEREAQLALFTILPICQDFCFMRKKDLKTLKTAPLILLLAVIMDFWTKLLPRT